MLRSKLGVEAVSRRSAKELDMQKPSQQEPKRVSRRFLIIYLALVALPTALFLYLGLHSLQRQAATITQLHAGTQSGAGQQLVDAASGRAESRRKCSEPAPSRPA